MNTEQISNEIERCFTFIEKPEEMKLYFHMGDCAHCSYLREDLKEFGDNELPPDPIRRIHQEMSCLSGEEFRWVLPSYLRYCLTDEAQYNQFETEFLLYHLNPAKKYEADTLERLSKLNQNQIRCLINFLKWCQEQKYWAEYCPDEIERAIHFLSKIKA